MADITLSKAVRSNLLSLQSTATQMAKTQERLATGLKVNSALDNPSNFFTASSLNSRAGDLSRLLDSVSNATQTIEAADNGISAITELVENAQATARQALQTTAQTTTSSVKGDSATATFAPASAVSVAGSGAAIVARIEGTTDVDGIDVTSTVSIDINGETLDLEAFDSGNGGDDNDTLSVAEFDAAIADWNSNHSASTGTTLTRDTATNHLVITQSDETSNITIDNEVGGSLSSLGLSTGTTTSTTTNLLQQGFTQGETLRITVGAVERTVVFGTDDGAGQVDSLTELQTALNSITSATVTVADNGNITIGADSKDDAVTIIGSATLSNLGLTAGEYTNLVNGTDGPVQQGEVLSIGISGFSPLNITFGTGAGEVNTFDELEEKLATLAGGKATIDSATGAISIEANDNSKSITVSSSNAASGRSASDIAAAFGLTNVVTAPITTDSATRQTLEDQYNKILSQIDDLSKDASFNGINLLDGDNLTVLFNEDTSSKLEINGTTFDSGGLGLSTLSSGTFQIDANVENVMDALNQASDLLKAQSTTFGSNLSVVQSRQDFTENMINTLETGASNLILADSNEEAANLLALQTRQQLSQTALSLASQADQNVLRLFS
jgi:flagellin